jgi:hypothetical protein
MASQFHAVIAPVLVEDRLRRAHDRRQAGGLNAGLTTTVSKWRGALRPRRRRNAVRRGVAHDRSRPGPCGRPAHRAEESRGTVSRGDVDSCTSHDQDKRRTMDCPQHVVSGWATWTGGVMATPSVTPAGQWRFVRWENCPQPSGTTCTMTSDTSPPRPRRSARVPPAIALVDPVMPRLEASHDDFQRVDGIPGLGLPIQAVPWMMVIVATLLIAAGLAGRAGGGGLPTAAIAVIGVGTVAVPFALSLTKKAAAADRIMKVGAISLSGKAADTATQTVAILNALAPAVQTKMALPGRSFSTRRPRSSPPRSRATTRTSPRD